MSGPRGRLSAITRPDNRLCVEVSDSADSYFASRQLGTAELADGTRVA